MRSIWVDSQDLTTILNHFGAFLMIWAPTDFVRLEIFMPDPGESNDSDPQAFGGRDSGRLDDPSLAPEQNRNRHMMML